MTTLKIHHRIPIMPRGPDVHRIDHVFPVLLLHVSTEKAGPQTSKHSRKGHDVLRTVRSNGLSADQQRAAVSIHCDQTQNKELHDFAGEVFVGLPALYSTDELSLWMSQSPMTGLKVTSRITRK